MGPKWYCGRKFYFPKRFVTFYAFLSKLYLLKSTRTTDAQWSLFALKSRNFGLGQTNWADEFWGIWGIFVQTISYQLFLQKKLSLYIHIPNNYFRLGFDLGRKELGIEPSCVRSPWKCTDAKIKNIWSHCDVQNFISHYIWPPV